MDIARGYEAGFLVGILKTVWNDIFAHEFPISREWLWCVLSVESGIASSFVRA